MIPAGKQIFFAPMEGLTDGVLRRVHSQLFGGVDVYGLPFHKLTHTFSLSTREKRDVSPAENAGLSVLPQALTKDAEQLRRWLGWIRDLGYPMADLNIGCPSPTVTRRGRGSGLLAEPDALRRLLDGVFDGLPLPLSVKTRIGFESAEEWPALLELLAAYPFSHITVHVRTTREQYTGGVHPEAFARTADDPRQRFVFNGDLRTPEDVRRTLEAFPHAAGVMIGRGLLADPSLARRARGGKPASAEELRAWYTALYAAWAGRFGASIALGRLKKLMVWPCESRPDAHEAQRLLRIIRKADSPEACLAAVRPMDP